MAYREFSYIGVGQVHLGLITAGIAGPLLSLGNVGELNYSFDEEKKTLRDYTSQGGGNANIISRIDSFTGSLKMHDYTAENLAKALRGLVTQVAAAPVTDEVHTSAGVDNELIPFEFSYDDAIAPVVTLTNATACVVDTDYELSPNGIKTLPGSNIDDAGVIISYTKAPSEVLEALVASGQEFVLFFDAVNEAQSGKSMSIRAHRVKFSPASGLGFLGGEFGEIPLDFEVLSDSSITGTGISKYMKIQQIT
jgi:hypothetical protein